MSNQIVSETKLCRKCKSEKEIVCFSKNSKARDGLYSWCKSCVKQNDQTRRADPEYKRLASEYEKKYRANPDYPRRRKERRGKYRADPLVVEKEFTYSQHYGLLKRYGMTISEFRDMHQKQNGACAICKTSVQIKRGKREKTINVDHNHKTGKVRGLLCHHCNLGLGQFKEDANLLRKAAEYLESFSDI